MKTKDINRMVSNLEDEIAAKLAQQIADEIDWGILADIYKSVGWTELHFSPHVEDLLSYEISTWMKLNLKGHYTSRGTRWLFEKQKDATMFVLRWSNA